MNEGKKGNGKPKEVDPEMAQWVLIFRCLHAIEGNVRAILDALKVMGVEPKKTE